VRELDMTTTVLGVDPGSVGAAVLLVDHAVVVVASWRTRQRNKRRIYDLVTWPETRRRDIVRTPHELGKRLAGLLALYRPPRAWDLVVEDVVARRNVGTAIKLARWSGQVAGPLEDLAVGPAQWVKADKWRAELLGIKRFTKRAVAKRKTVDAIAPHYGDVLTAASSDLDRALEDIVDAAGIALWADGQNLRTG
jgi:hypothetical protein